MVYFTNPGLAPTVDSSHVDRSLLLTPTFYLPLLPPRTVIIVSFNLTDFFFFNL